MTTGIIPTASIPGWPSPARGIMETLATTLAAGGFDGSFISPDGLHVGDVSTAQNHLNSYVGSNKEFQWNQTDLQNQLDVLFNRTFNLPQFIRDGTVTPVTGTQVANFLATITSNYRSKRSDISSATTLAQLNAININAGWPANP